MLVHWWAEPGSEFSGCGGGVPLLVDRASSQNIWLPFPCVPKLVLAHWWVRLDPRVAGWGVHVIPELVLPCWWGQGSESLGTSTQVLRSKISGSCSWYQPTSWWAGPYSCSLRDPMCSRAGVGLQVGRTGAMGEPTVGAVLLVYLLCPDKADCGTMVWVSDHWWVRSGPKQCWGWYPPTSAWSCVPGLMPDNQWIELGLQSSDYRAWGPLSWKIHSLHEYTHCI